LQTSINHIVFMVQENRSFDNYFGKLNDYRATLGLTPDVDGIPAQGFTNPDVAGTGTVSTFHQTDACIENTSPAWNESHVDYNRHDPASDVATMDGFVFTAAGDSKANHNTDPKGIRTMGYYTADELNYYYFMATAFATSDRWFSPASSTSPTNRFYTYAATSEGIVYNIGANGGPPHVTHKTIFQEADEAGLTWKVYFSNGPTGTNTPAQFFFDYGFLDQHQAGHWVPLSQYFTDVQNGTLPQVALIESSEGLNEHPGQGKVLFGQHYVSTIINALMSSPSWKDSVFILTYDEGGGLFDHVPPVSTVSPDGIKPVDLKPGDVPGDFTRTGFRVPVIVVSPWVKKNFVSHAPADHTAIFKLIETRFSLPSLTARDAAAPDMTEFFDFSNATAPQLTPPTPPPARDPNTMPCGPQ
jgi:phospholipase C